MEICIVTYNGKVSQEAYKTSTEARQFIRNRLGMDIDTDEGWSVAENDKGDKYEIHWVRVKGL